MAKWQWNFLKLYDGITKFRRPPEMAEICLKGFKSSEYQEMKEDGEMETGMG